MQLFDDRCTTTVKLPLVTCLTLEPRVVHLLARKVTVWVSRWVPIWCTAGRNLIDPVTFVHVMLPEATTTL